MDLASRAVFRIAFGLMMFVEVLRYTSYGWVTEYYVQPTFHFGYFGLEWVKPWPGSGMYWHFAALGLLALCITAGLFYRVAAALFAVGITYVFLLDQTHYLNHMYLICLLSALMVLLPGDRLWSLDVKLRGVERRDFAPRWSLVMIQLQLGLVYFFGGIAKLEPDWLSGVPGAMFLEDSDLTRPLTGSVIATRMFAVSGALFDLFIVPALVWRRTRPFAIAAVLFFNLFNFNLFDIGIFPWLMLAATPIFFSPDWPRGVLSTAQPRTAPAPEARVNGWILGLLGGWFLIQLVLPLRHWLYPGDVNWTEEGHNFSWHMKLRVKYGDLRFFSVDPRTRVRAEVDPHRYLTERQVTKMSTRPDMIVLFARFLGERLDAEIYAHSWVSLNGRPDAPIVDPRVNLAAVERSLRPASWITRAPPGPPRYVPYEEE